MTPAQTKAVEIFTVLLLGASLFAVYASVSRARRAEARVKRLDHFCHATRDAIRQDRRALESGDVARQEEAFARFYEGRVMYHNSASIALCLEAETDLPPISLDCRLDKNWSCLAQLAARIEQQLQEQ